MSAAPSKHRAASEIIIDAPIEKIWAIMIDVDAYPSWNPFVVRVRVLPEGTPIGFGVPMKFDVVFAPSGRATSVEETIEFRPPTRWVYAFRGTLDTLGLVRGNRIQALESLGPNKTRYSSTEEFTGLFVSFIPLAKVQDGFDRQAAALKARAESI